MLDQWLRTALWPSTARKCTKSTVCTNRAPTAWWYAVIKLSNAKEPKKRQKVTFGRTDMVHTYIGWQDGFTLSTPTTTSGKTDTNVLENCIGSLIRGSEDMLGTVRFDCSGTVMQHSSEIFTIMLSKKVFSSYMGTSFPLSNPTSKMATLHAHFYQVTPPAPNFGEAHVT